MNKKNKKTIVLMFIPLIGIWWVFDKIIPSLKPIDWFDYSVKGKFIIIGSFFYQLACFISLKLILS